MSISLTESAARHVRKFLAATPGAVALRVGIRTTGCSGYAYQLEPLLAVAANDLVWESHGIVLAVAPEVLPTIDGTQVDYVREGLNATLRFNNPNVKATCGCGESFSI